MMRTSRALLLPCALAVSLFAQPATAIEAPSVPDILFIARHLDVLSFPSSIHPRMRPGAYTLMDYGFTHFNKMKPEGNWKPNGVESIEDDGEWYFAVVLIADHGSSKDLCVLDEANNGGTYRGQTLIRVKLEPDGMYRATKVLEENSC